MLLINGIINVGGLEIMGLVTKNLAGTVNSIDDGKIWFNGTD